MNTFTIGQTVEFGHGMDYRRGEVVSIDGIFVTVKIVKEDNQRVLFGELSLVSR